MLAISLGLAWLLLAPISLWILIRGRNLARAGALLTLVLLEGGTIAAQDLGGDPAPAVAAHTVTTPANAQAPATCEERAPVPASARIIAHRDLRLTWAAAPDECGTAKVVLAPRAANCASGSTRARSRATTITCAHCPSR